MHVYGRPPLVFKPHLPRHFNFNLMILYHVYVCLLNLRIQVIDSKKKNKLKKLKKHFGNLTNVFSRFQIL